jgi:hypothetical protein
MSSKRAPNSSTTTGKVRAGASSIFAVISSARSHALEAEISFRATGKVISVPN